MRADHVAQRYHGMKNRPPLYLSFDLRGRSPNTLHVQFGFGQNYIKTVYFRSDTKTLRASGDVLFCLGILPAMELGIDLVIGEPVDGDLLDNSDDIQTLIGEWYPWYSRIKIVAERGHSTYPDHRGSGLFYSGGVDSSYSLAMEAQRLDALVTIFGIDAGIDKTKQSSSLRDNLIQVASSFDLEAIEVETNIRDISDQLIGWEEYHGSLLAAVRHMLADHLENQIIAATFLVARRARQWGTHPELDPLFGTKNAPIEHHGIIDRFTKIQRVADDDRLLKPLKVCYKSHVNCGVCRKCIFAMISLDVIEKIDQATSFPRDKLGHGIIHVFSDMSRLNIIQLRKAALKHGGKQTLIAQLDAALRRYNKVEAFSRMLGPSNWKPRFKRLKRQLRYSRRSRMTRSDRARSL
jgi:hypothetical protein